MSEKAVSEPYSGIVREMFAYAFAITSAEKTAREACARVIALYPEGLGRKTALRYVRREALRLADPERTPYEFLDNSASLSGEITAVRRAAMLLDGAKLSRRTASRLMRCSVKKLDSLYSRAVSLAGAAGLKRECDHEMREIASFLSVPSLNAEVRRQNALIDAKEGTGGRYGRLFSLLALLFALLLIGVLVWLAASFLAYYRELRLERIPSSAILEDVYARILRKG
ncbi:MAG: hypothetical protein K5663_11735 [Clostridiales bacterium]|nr:hypothetical protein [Clostridiales bacterium]